MLLTPNNDIPYNLISEGNPVISEITGRIPGIKLLGIKIPDINEIIIATEKPIHTATVVDFEYTPIRTIIIEKYNTDNITVHINKAALPENNPKAPVTIKTKVVPEIAGSKRNKLPEKIFAAEYPKQS